MKKTRYKVYFQYKNNQHRSKLVGDSFKAAINAAGDSIVDTAKKADVGIFYGMSPGHISELRDMRSKGKKVIGIDLGYWDRNITLRFDACYKVSVHHFHPQDYIHRLNSGADRFNLTIRPWANNPKGHVLLAGLGPKSMELYDIDGQTWDKNMIKEIKKYTSRKIIYRPKPSWRDAPPIPGTEFSAPDQSLAPVLKNAWAIVTHHSNVSTDGLLYGIPCFCWDGAAYKMASQDVTEIEAPFKPKNRKQFFQDLSYINWSVKDILEGRCWNHIKKEVFPLVYNK